MIEIITALLVAILFIPLLRWIVIRKKRSRKWRLAMEYMERRDTFFFTFGTYPGAISSSETSVEQIVRDRIHTLKVRSFLVHGRKDFSARRIRDIYIKACLLALKFGYILPEQNKAQAQEKRRKAQ